MKRDADLIRQLLLEVERHEEPTTCGSPTTIRSR